MTDTERKTVLLTGSGSGLGRAARSLFAERGWNVASTSRTVTAEHAEAGSDRVLVLPLDVRDQAAVSTAFTATLTRFGRVDCVVNNAGVGLFSVFEATPMAVVRDLFDINVFGLMQVTQAAVRHFRDAGGGRLVNLSSGAGIVPEPLMSVYAATKFAVEGFTESLRYELAGEQVSVALIEPGLVIGTGFLPRTAQSSAAVPVPAPYQSLVGQMSAVWQHEPPSGLATEAAVAEAILAAATDDPPRLRYVVGEDAQTSARMRRQTSETEYDAWAIGRYPAPA
jgi:NAD(P)-dependent dehydrogenase (short-subunit alcohol dehydrogenase family)